MSVDYYSLAEFDILEECLATREGTPTKTPSGAVVTICITDAQDALTNQCAAERPYTWVLTNIRHLAVGGSQL